MPRAEAGSTKQLNNAMKSKGLQRLRWYCQVCERQMRDENGFKMHTQSEGHVRQMLLIGEDPKKYINDYSNQFQRDFLLLLRTSHGEKQVMMNHFYQEYIANKEHVHMNATKWPSLTEYAKHLGREGICRVEETDKGLQISWVDNSPEALRRQDAIRKKERQDRGDEEREQAQIKEQIKKAQTDAEARRAGADGDENDGELMRAEGEKFKLSFGPKSAVTKASAPRTVGSDSANLETKDPTMVTKATADKASESAEPHSESDVILITEPAAPATLSLKMGLPSKPKNVFAAAKKNALASKKFTAIEQPKKMSEAERIMKEEIEKRGKRAFTGPGGPSQKKQRF